MPHNRNQKFAFFVKKTQIGVNIFGVKCTHCTLFHIGHSKGTRHRGAWQRDINKCKGLLQLLFSIEYWTHLKKTCLFKNCYELLWAADQLLRSVNYLRKMNDYPWQTGSVFSLMFIIVQNTPKKLKIYNFYGKMVSDNFRLLSYSSVISYDLVWSL